MSSSPIAQLIDKLKHFLSTEKNKLAGDYLKIADAALAQLNEYKSTISDSQSWEFYLTVNEIIKVLMPAAKAQDMGLLRSTIRAVFSRRQKLLKGDTLDIHSKTLGNSFSLEVAKIIFPDENPENVLLADALTENRVAPWQDHISMTGDLPAQGQFFRNASNQIELYAVILERAITRLKEGYFELDKIWLESDPKIESKGEVDASAFEQPLSRLDYYPIKYRSPAFRRLMEYSEGLEETIKYQTKTAFDHFHDLRVGLLKGDAQHAGSELQAGGEAYAAIVQFYKWWESLPLAKKDQIRALSVTNSMYGSVNQLSAILDIIMDVGNADQRNAVRYCIQIKGKMLDEIISNPTVRDTLTRLSDEQGVALDPRVPNQTLDEWQTQIMQDLDQLAPEIKQDDQFSVFVKSKGIVLQTVMHNFFDYSLLQDASLSLLKSWFRAHGYDVPRSEDADLLEMVGEIQLQQSTNALLLLYAHYSYNPDDMHSQATSRKNILLTAIKNRLYDLSLQNGFPFESLRQGFPFFDTVINEDEITAMHWLSAQFSVEGSDTQWRWTQNMLENSRLNANTQPLLLNLIQRARQLGRDDRADMLEKILARDVVLREIAAYEALIKSRIGGRHSQQREDSLRCMKVASDRSLSTLDIQQLKASLQAEIAEAKADHARTSWLTWFTSSNLAYYYQRALDVLNTLQGGNNGPAGPGGDVPPPPPPPASAAASPPPPPPPPAPIALPLEAMEALHVGEEFNVMYRRLNSQNLYADHRSFAYAQRFMMRMREEAALMASQVEEQRLMFDSQQVESLPAVEFAPVERSLSFWGSPLSVADHHEEERDSEYEIQQGEHERVMQMY